VAHAGVDPTHEGHDLQDALRAAIATRRGSCSWDVDHASWVVTLHSPEKSCSSGRPREERPVWCLVTISSHDVFMIDITSYNDFAPLRSVQGHEAVLRGGSRAQEGLEREASVRR
jgi:hypothetical protein